MRRMKTLLLAGSTRQHSLNRKLIDAASALVRAQNAEPTVANLADFDIPLYNADLEARGTPADVIRFKALMHAHPAWLIATPEYNGSYPALLKNLIDWCSSPVKSDPEWTDGLKPFRGKVVGMLSASPGAMGGLRAQSHLAPLLLNCGCWVAPKAFALGRAGEAFDANGAFVHARDEQAVSGVVEQVLFAARRMSS
jgi:chromate reductase, NAD(P)H dehydrogenase (quinone)